MGIAHKKSDPELRERALAFFEAFRSSVATSEKNIARIFDSGFAFIHGTVVEFTEEVQKSLQKLAVRAAELLGARTGNERALRAIALKQAQESLVKNADPGPAVTALIDRLFEEGNVKFDFLVPNYLISFKEGVRSIQIGRVRAMLTEDFEAELAAKPKRKIRVTSDKGFSVAWSAEGALVRMQPVCWVVSVNATKENVEEEAKWLIDIAISFLRMHYKRQNRRYPQRNDIEPHPILPKETQKVGVKISDATTHLGGGRLLPNYEVGKTILKVTRHPSFVEKARLIFDPLERSLAQRVSQSLGWLTRGRQAEDRAERLLYFFTAIEALLSSNDTTAPVVQTIARHASVILTDNNIHRAEFATQIRKLYSIRSSLVHSGNRAVLWSNADATHYIAENVIWNVLGKCELKSSHNSFIDVLARSSYGMPWPDAKRRTARKPAKKTKSRT